MVLRWILRILFFIFLIFPLFFWSDFITHFLFHFTGSVYSFSAEGKWLLVTANILFFIGFLIPLSYRRKVDWREKGLVSAFFISLFIEMYGISFSLLFASKLINNQTATPGIVLTTKLLGVSLDLTFAMAYSTIVMGLGGLIIFVGWINLYLKRREKDLITTGVYRISRHPQYLGFILIIYGWWLGWPTLLTSILSPILIYKYIRLTWVEEKELENKKEYAAYRKITPRLI